ncbi:MAG: HEAT repeat domain-containing protein [Planctomycetes bacterium]|nr:HEAT repeat domain-containing protein [Planctomycetota bacterium]
MNSLLLALILFAQDADSKKSAQQLFTEGQRLETVDRDFARAAAKYQKAADKARTDGNKTLLAAALHNLARCHESSDPDNVAGALDAYGKIVAECGDVEPYASTAKRKLEWQGVDVYLGQYRAVLEKWRETRGSTAALTASREAVWAKIQALDAKALPGLLEALALDDEVLRDFASDCLSRLVDTGGVAKVVEKLKDPNAVARGGASLTLEKVFRIWREANLLDEQAAKVRRDFDLAKLGGGDVSDVEAEIKNAEKTVEEAKKGVEEAEAAAKGGSAADKEFLDSQVTLARMRLRQAEDHLKMLQNVKSTQERAADLESRAAKVRHNIPKDLNAAEIQNALASVIADENADATARLEAATAAQSIGDISGSLVAALVAGMQSGNRNVRIGCARAAAAVTPAEGAHKHKLAEVLMDLVQYEPEKQWTAPTVSPEEEKQIRDAIAAAIAAKDEEAEAAIAALVAMGDKIEESVQRTAGQASAKARIRLETALSRLRARRWANDPLVRQAAAQSLGRIGLVKAVPALIEALEDNDAGVRREANEALVALTRVDVGYESDPRVADPERKMDEATKRAEQLKIRGEGIKRWKEWWAKSSGVDVVVDRFWTFQQRWTSYDAADLFDRDLFIRKVLSTSSQLSRQWDKQRAERIHDAFQRDKKVFVMDAVDLGEGALDRLLERLDGKSDQEKIFEKLGKVQRDRLVAKSRAATRLFVAEAVAELGKKTNAAKVAATLAGMLGDEKGAGAAAALGCLGREVIGTAGIQALVGSGLTSANEATLEAAATALMKAGDESCAEGLTTLAASASADASVDSPRVRAAVAALRALTALKPKNPKTLETVGEMVGHEPEDNTGSRRAASDLVREFACDTLGALGTAEAAPYLLRARRDAKRNVRDAAGAAIRELFKSQPEISRKLLETLRDEKRSSQDRIGAALGIGDTGHEPRVHDLVWRILDRNPPRDLRDPDPAVRAAVCRALGAIKSKTQLAIESLMAALSDPAEEVRQEAYFALRETVGADTAAQIKVAVREVEGRNPEPQEFKGWYTQEIRKKFLELWKRWYEGKKGELRKEPDKEV